MPEVPAPRDGHCHSELVCSGDHLIVTDGAPGLHHEANPELAGRLGYNDYSVVEQVFTMKRLNAAELKARGY